jgi:hypothetical protein
MGAARCLREPAHVRPLDAEARARSPSTSSARRHRRPLERPASTSGPAAGERARRIDIDLGGTKIEGIALDETGRELARQRLPTPQGHYDGTVAAVADLVRAIESATGHQGTVGVGIPGALSRVTGLVKNANSTCLIGKPLQRDLETALSRPIRLANDANCFALSEAVDGAGKNERVVFGVILGTGVGGGIVVDGRNRRSKQSPANGATTRCRCPRATTYRSGRAAAAVRAASRPTFVGRRSSAKVAPRAGMRSRATRPALRARLRA